MLFVRCDDRLIHGQVLFKWVDHKKISKIIVVDDGILSDNIEKQMLMMSKPKNCDIEIIGSGQISQIKTDDLHQMILFKSIELASFYVLKKNITKLNIGRMSSGIGKKKLYNNIFLDENEKLSLKKLASNGVFIYYQMVPEENIVDLTDLVKE